MHPQRLTVMVIAVLGNLSAFLPWAALESVGVVNVFEIDIHAGWYLCGLFGLPFVLGWQGKKQHCIPRTHTTISSVSFLLAFWLSYHSLEEITASRSLYADVGTYAAMTLSVLGLLLIWLLRRNCRTKKFRPT
ncbi:MAG: hypothetical protein ACFCUI_03995 [Bernardetiaceae bacterium]